MPSIIHQRKVVQSIPAMLAYWDSTQRCVFSNAAYKIWFGKSPEEMKQIEMRQLLGEEVYAKNLPYIQGVLEGKQQVFERQLTLPDGTVRESLATYIPDIEDGVVRGFSVHVTDITAAKRREESLCEALRDTVQVLRETKRSFRSKELAELRTRLEFHLKERSR